MTSPVLRLVDRVPTREEGDVLVLFVQAAGEVPVVLGRETDAVLVAQVRATGRADQTVRIPAGVFDERPVLLVGVGSSVDASSLRAAAGAAARASGGDIRMVLDAGPATEAQLTALLEGAALGAYVYAGRPVSAADRQPAKEFVVVGSSDRADALVERAGVVADAVVLTRDLANTPPSQQGPDDLARSAVEAADGLPIDVRVWDEAALAEDGFGGILGVGSGSVRPPRLVRLDYAPEGAPRHLALVGKGITFDSGGLSLKPPASMVGMKYDMAGAASVLAVVTAVARLGLPVHVTGWMCIAENLPSGSAIRPNDVLTIRGGTRVEVLNTDAEGRLVLADGLQAATEEHPDVVIDIATLTGAQIVALGTRYSAVMGDDDVVERLTEAASGAGELLWPMPLPGELRARLNTEVADIANATPGNSAGGMLLAGVFLREFVGRRSDVDNAVTVPWAHLDIAGSAQNDGAAYGYVGKGATGVLVRTLVDTAESLGVQESISGR
ncbi:leucyl aminopeptidase [Humibacter ginsenosidimutans]|uniref:Probable cytosol aminopeptidase n=1 Tax=Humibacter ginsenosidimutans TaxID=2599293 RepID=A0A5B8LZT3_9MICO|nr:leucyl aminopeptidase [Humibacter ginsenosidimutans]QDZ13887.1 leucyl aminopeptidase [Humibacter ginsenosidimutans]